MLINGLWLLCDDGAVRPVVRGAAQAADGSWVQMPFLVDTGADRTVFSAEVLAALGLFPFPSADRLGGVGGEAPSVVVETVIRFLQEDNSPVLFRGQYAAFTALEAFDMSVLGRDITNLFALIVDRAGDRVCLLGQRHRYTIEQRIG
jgi:hypothetical protein